MSAQSRTILKTYFETGDFPSQAEFANLIDSFLSIVSDFRLLFGTVSQTGTNAPVLATMFSTLSFVPVFNYVSPGTFTIDNVGELDASKVIIIIPNYSDGTTGVDVYSTTSPDQFEIDTFDPASTPANNVLADRPFLMFVIP